MNDGLVDAFRYNAWATRELLRFCAALPGEAMDATTVGTAGSIRRIFEHILEAESYYLYLLTGEKRDWRWEPDCGTMVAALEEAAAVLAEAWDELLQTPIDADAVFVRVEPWKDRAGIVIVQAIHHGNVHREQVNMILTSLAIEPPDLDVWSFDRATGTTHS
ncbi:MAG: DinB family protein [Dehalococcoidia bacterium]